MSIDASPAPQTLPAHPPSDPDEAVDTYFRQCSIDVTCRDLSMMAATMANSGINPVSGERALSTASVERVLSVMTTCGMYDGSGTWVADVGRDLAAMLDRAASFLELENSRWLERALKVFEPVLMLGIGLVIGGVVVLLYLPIFELAGALR